MLLLQCSQTKPLLKQFISITIAVGALYSRHPSFNANNQSTWFGLEQCLKSISRQSKSPFGDSSWFSHYYLMTDRTQLLRSCSWEGKHFFIFGSKIRIMLGFGLQSFGVSTKTVRLFLIRPRLLRVWSVPRWLFTQRKLYLVHVV